MRTRPAGTAMVFGAAFAVMSSFAAVAGGASAPSVVAPDQSSGRSNAAVRQAIRSLPWSFVANTGQSDPRVSFYVQGSTSTSFFTPGGMTLAMDGWTVRQRFPGSTATVPVAGGRRGGIVSYFHGSSNDWRTGIPAFPRITYRGLWSGIDLTYSGSNGALEYTFNVAPGADPERIAVAYDGATVGLTPEGELRVDTPSGGFVDRAPVAYQTVDGRRAQVAASFVSLPDHPEIYGFQVGAYDRAVPLVIDPVQIGYAGYVGGAGYEDPYGIGVDAQGYAYFMGATKSDDKSFPVTAGPGLKYRGNSDAFVCKVEPDGSGLDYCGYIGGKRWDRGRAITVDAAGNAYVIGHTKSTVADGFPATVGPDLSQNGDADAFVCKVNPTGTALDYCGYIGGAKHDEGKAIAVDAAGNAYVTGGAKSSENDGFPVAVGPDLTAGGGGDVWVAKVSADGTHLVYCGYIGGSHDEHARGIDVDASGDAYVGGSTASSQGDGFPVLVGPDLTFNGARDAFVSKVSPDGSSLVYSGYVGGDGTEEVYGLRVNASGNAYIAGSTNATEATFPVKVGPDLTYNGGRRDAFVTEVSVSGAALVYSGFIGGSEHDGARGGLDLDASGDAFVTGGTKSSEATFPAFGGPDPSYNGGQDAFVSEIAPDGSHLIFSGYIGGKDYEEGRGIAVGADGTVYLGGATRSHEGSFPLSGGPDLTYNGGKTDGFVASLVPS